MGAEGAWGAGFFGTQHGLHPVTPFAADTVRTHQPCEG